MDWVKAIAGVLVTSTFTWVFSGLIALLGIGAYLGGLLRGYLRLRAGLRTAVARLEQSPPTREKFAENFATFDGWAGKDPLLGHAWGQFKQSLIFPQPGEAPVILSTHQASFFFDEDGTLHPHINLRLYTSVPNFLTGLGIFGTFLGLAAGIYSFQGDLLNALKRDEGLQNLLKGAALAFVTSIAGLATSIPFAWIEKVHVHGLQRLLSRWNDGLDRRVQLVTPEFLAQRQLEELRKQSEALETFNSQLAFNVAAALDQRLGERLEPVFEKLTQTLDALRQDRRQTNEAMLQDLVRQFREAMQGTAGREMDGLARSLAEMSALLGPVLQGLRESQDRMSGLAESLISRVQQTFGAEQARLTEALNRAVADTLTPSLKGLGDGLRTLHEQTAEVIQRVNDAFAQRQGQMVETLRTATAAASSGITEAGQSFSAQLTQTIEGAATRLGESLASLNAAILGLRDVAQSVGQVVDQTRIAFSNMRDVSTAFKETQRALDRSAQSLGAAATQVETAGSGVARAGERATELSTGLTETVRSLSAQWAEHQRRFHALDGALERAFRQVTEGLDAYAKQTKQYIEALDSHTGAITQSLGGAVQELSEVVEDLGRKK